MKKLFLTILLVLFYGLVSAEEFQQIDDRTLYYFTSDKQITLEWDGSTTGATEYDMYLYNTEHKEIQLRANIPHPTHQITFQVPRTGHYVAHVRAAKTPLESSMISAIDSKTTMADLKALVLVDNGVCDAAEWWDDNATLAQMKTTAKAQKGLCSKYIESTNKDHAQVIKVEGGTPVPQGWWLFGYPAPPSGGGIE